MTARGFTSVNPGLPPILQQFGAMVPVVYFLIYLRSRIMLSRTTPDIDTQKDAGDVIYTVRERCDRVTRRVIWKFDDASKRGQLKFERVAGGYGVR